jgi:hypothetical protein
MVLEYRPAPDHTQAETARFEGDAKAFVLGLQFTQALEFLRRAGFDALVQAHYLDRVSGLTRHLSLSLPNLAVKVLVEDPMALALVCC